jgi:hypothetical protein
MLHAKRGKLKQQKKKPNFFFSFMLHSSASPTPSSSSIDFHFSTLSRSTLSLFALRSLPTSQPLSPYLYSLLCRRRRSTALSLSSANVSHLVLVC